MKIILLLFTLLLTGCSDGEEMPSFILNELGSISLEDTETPIRYDVNHTRAQDQVIINRNEMVSPYSFSIAEETYDLDDVTVTDDEIIIKYEGQVEIFTRLSESVVENDDKVWYQYINPAAE